MDNRRICTDPRELLELPYMRRQLIVVADDKEIKSELRAREAATRSTAARHEADLQKAEQKQQEEREKAMEIKHGWRGVVSHIHMPDLEVDFASLPVIENVIDAMSGDNDELDVLTIGYRATSALVFPVGHPRFGILYVGHPTLTGTYYPAASFHRLTFEHKFYEALKLIMSLGASRLTVERISGWEREVAVEVGASFGLVKGDAHRKKTANSRILFEADLNGAEQPSLPTDLVWYPYEPTWQAIADGRLKYGIKNFNLVIEYIDDFNINAKLSAKAGKLGLDLGGKFNDLEATTWNMSGEFPS